MLEFLQAGGPFMYVLVATSIIALALILERSLALRWGRVIPPTVEETMISCRDQEDVDRLRLLCEESNSPLSQLLVTAVDHLNLPRSDTVEALQTQARHVIVQLERGLVFLEIIVGIAPLMGLVGTIHGLIRMFGDLGKTGLGDNSVVAAGIAIALNTTLTGLLIAIPSLVAWSYYSKKVEVMAIEMERLCDEFVRHQYRRKKSSKP
jgi:biopolymer transport protein ExbB